jgi:putative SOS response-associated peptidase YedK
MPVILRKDSYDEWLDVKGKDIDRLQKFLTPYSAKEMSSYAVSRSVNIPDTNSPELIKPMNSL